MELPCCQWRRRLSTPWTAACTGSPGREILALFPLQPQQPKELDDRSFAVKLLDAVIKVLND